MKTLSFILTSFVFAILFFSCEKKKEDPTPSVIIKYSPIVSWVKSGQIPLIYEGDTVKYKITSTAANDITELAVYKVNNSTGAKTLLSGYPKTTFADAKNITEYLYMPVGLKSDFTPFYLSIEVKENNNTSKTLNTDKYTALSELTEQKNLRIGRSGTIQNKVNSYAFSEIFVDYGNSVFYFEGTYSIDGIRSDYVFSDPNTRVYVNRSAYVKIPDSYYLFDSPSKIIAKYQSVKSNASYVIKPILVGDVLVAKINPTTKDTINVIPTNAIIKINTINDVDTIDDELYFDAKIFNPYRFK